MARKMKKHLPPIFNFIILQKMCELGFPRSSSNIRKIPKIELQIVFEYLKSLDRFVINKKIVNLERNIFTKKFKSGKSATVNCTSFNTFSVTVAYLSVFRLWQGYTGIITSDSESDSVVDMMTKSQSEKKIT